MSLETEERGNFLMQKIFGRITCLQHPGFSGRHAFVESRKSVKLKQDRFKENITYTHHHQTDKANDKEKYEKPWRPKGNGTIFFNVVNENGCELKIL